MFSIKETFFGVVVAFAFGCLVTALFYMDSPPAPEDAIPNLKKTLDWLRSSKTAYEYGAATSRRDMNLSAGKVRYENARAAFDNVIVEMRDSLWGIEGSKSPEGLHELMQEANKLGDDFQEWRYPTKTGNTSSAETSAISDVTGIVAVAVSLAQMREAQNQDVRTYVVGEIENCELRPWDQVRGN